MRGAPLIPALAAFLLATALMLSIVMLDATAQPTLTRLVNATARLLGE